jgi:hypothetical protein
MRDIVEIVDALLYVGTPDPIRPMSAVLASMFGMTAQQLAGTFGPGNLPRQLFDAERLLEELHHPHPLRRAAACEAADRVIGLATDRFIFWEGTRAEVWERIFDGELLQRDIDNGKPRKGRSCDPMREVGALLVVEALARVVALRARTECAVDLGIELKSEGEIGNVLANLLGWMSAAWSSTQAA